MNLASSSCAAFATDICCDRIAGTWKDTLAESEAKTAKLQARREAEAKHSADTAKRLQEEKAALQARVSSLEAAERERASSDDAQRAAVMRQIQSTER